MTGAEYADAVASYVARRFLDRGLKAYREVYAGQSIIGKNRRVDIMCICEAADRAIALECKYQESLGTVDEKIPYSLDDLAALPMAGCLVYAGTGFSKGVLHMLAASPHAAFCLPRPNQIGAGADTKELDHVLAMHFGWWDILVEGKAPVT